MESDSEFLDSLEQWVIGSLVFKREHRDRLFALARRGAEQNETVLDLLGHVGQLSDELSHARRGAASPTRTEIVEGVAAFWDRQAMERELAQASAKMVEQAARIAQLEAALREIASSKMRTAMTLRPIARAALEDRT